MEFLVILTLVFSMIVGLAAIIISVISLILFWQLLKKVGMPGWYALIPGWNILVMSKIGTNKFTLGVLLLVSTFGNILFSNPGNVLAFVVSMLLYILTMAASISLYYFFFRAYAVNSVAAVICSILVVPGYLVGLYMALKGKAQGEFRGNREGEEFSTRLSGEIYNRVRQFSGKVKDFVVAKIVLASNTQVPGVQQQVEPVMQPLNPSFNNPSYTPNYENFQMKAPQFPMGQPPMG